MQLFDFTPRDEKCFLNFKSKNRKKPYLKGIEKFNQGLYSKILLAINQEIIEYVVSTGKPFKLSWGLGTLQMKKLKPITSIVDGRVVTNRPIDWLATKNMWEKDPSTKEDKKYLYYMNDHTDGYLCFSRYEKSSHFPFPSCWEFITSRYFDRFVNDYLRSNKGTHHKYEEVISS